MIDLFVIAFTLHHHGQSPQPTAAPPSERPPTTSRPVAADITANPTLTTTIDTPLPRVTTLGFRTDTDLAATVNAHTNGLKTPATTGLHTQTNPSLVTPLAQPMTTVSTDDGCFVLGTIPTNFERATGGCGGGHLR